FDSNRLRAWCLLATTFLDSLTQGCKAEYRLKAPQSVAVKKCERSSSREKPKAKQDSDLWK
ncbi:unnamed protein product, partial [Arabidopsis thaliana]